MTKTVSLLILVKIPNTKLRYIIRNIYLFKTWAEYRTTIGSEECATALMIAIIKNVGLKTLLFRYIM